MSMADRQREKKLAASKGKHAVKVVYITSPMKLKTTASNFRSLVQELTGQGAVWPLDISHLSSSTLSACHLSHNQTAPIHGASVTENGAHVGSGGAPEMSAGLNSDLYLQPLDQDVYQDGGEDRVVLIDRHLLNTVLDDHHDFFGVDSRNF